LFKSLEAWIFLSIGNMTIKQVLFQLAILQVLYFHSVEK